VNEFPWQMLKLHEIERQCGSLEESCSASLKLLSQLGSEKKNPGREGNKLGILQVFSAVFYLFESSVTSRENSCPKNPF
jgi:hypothetical protein